MSYQQILSQLTSTYLQSENFLREKKRCDVLNISSKNWDTKLSNNINQLKKLNNQLELELQNIENKLENDDNVQQLEWEFVNWSKKIRQLESSMNSKDSDTNGALTEMEARTELFQTKKTNPNESFDQDDLNKNTENNDQFADFSNNEILTFQQQTMDEQDRNLDILSESINRQRDFGMNIGTELDTHIELLEETDLELNDTELRLNTAQRRLNRIRTKISENRLNTTILVLFLILLLVIVLSKYFGH